MDNLDRASLERRYLANPGDIVRVAGCSLHVRDTGPKSAPAVIMIHGFGSSLQTWDGWARNLEADHRVIRFDLPGSGLSAPDPTGDYTDARSITLLMALQDLLGLEHTSVVGHSIGGRMAWTFAAQQPARVDKLVLVAPDGFASPGFQYGEPAQIPATFTLMRYVLPKAMLRMSLAPAYAVPDKLTDEVTTRYHDLMRAPGAREALLQRLQQTVLVDPLPFLKSIRAPTLLIWGEGDAMIPITNAAEYLKALPDARLVAIPGAGHLPHEEAAERSAGAVRDFLK